MSALIQFFYELSIMQRGAVASAAATLLAALVTYGGMLGGSRCGRWRIPGVRHGFVVVLLLGTTSAVIHAVLLTMRLVQAGAEFLMGYPWIGLGNASIGLWGLATLSVLLLVLVLAVVCTRQQRLATCAYWNLVMLAVWAVTLLPVVRPNGTGGYSRTGVLLLLISSLSVVLGVTSLVASLFLEGGGRRQDRGRQLPPGLGISVLTIAAAVGLLSWCQTLTPCTVVGQLTGFQPIAVVACLGLSGLACLRLVQLTGAGGALADAVLGLFSLSVAGVSACSVAGQDSLAEYFPVLLNALTVGFSAAACGAGFLALWSKSRDADSAGPAAQAIGAAAARFVFLNGVIAFLSAMMMAFWPRLPGIAAMDDSYGRVISGFAANFLLLLVMLWASRRLNRIPLHVMTVLVLCSAIGFVAARVLPFASHVN